jgi:hypothetical protein
MFAIDVLGGRRAFDDIVVMESDPARAEGRHLASLGDIGVGSGFRGGIRGTEAGIGTYLFSSNTEPCCDTGCGGLAAFALPMPTVSELLNDSHG